MKKNPIQDYCIANDQLRAYTGTEQYYIHQLGLKFTDGVFAAREMFECYWLIDDIAIFRKEVKNQPFQLWVLEREITGGHRTNRFTLRCEDGNYKLLWKKEYSFSDFKPDQINFYLEYGVLLLPSEH